VNPLTDKIYIANGNGSVTAIDGVTNNTATVTAGTSPYGVAVNPVTNKVYVANFGSNNITVIDGATNNTTTVAVGTNPYAVAVNPITNKIYTANFGSNDVTVIDGASNNTATVTAGTNPQAVAVNPVTNKIYVANNGSSNVTVIDGATNNTTTVATGTISVALAVNPVTDKVYVANSGSGNVTVIDGATNTTTTLAVGAIWGAVNLVTNKVYLGNFEITEQQVQAIPLQASITPLTGNTTASLTATFNFTASSTFSPMATTPDSLLFQVDTWQGSWTAGTSQGSGGFSGRTSALQPGFHFLYSYATDGQEATSTNTGPQSSPLISNVSAYGFLVLPPNAAISPSSLDFGKQVLGTTSAAKSVTISDSGGPLTISSITITGANSGDFKETNHCGTSVGANTSCAINVTFIPSTAAAESATVTITDDSGGVPGSTQTVNLTGGGIDFGFAVASNSSSSATVTAGQSATYTISVSPLGGFNQTITISCSGAPTAATCTPSPGSVTLDGTNSQNVTVTVATTARGMFPPLISPRNVPRMPTTPFLLVCLVGLMIALGFLPTRRLRPQTAFALLALCIISLAGLSACGGGSSGPPPPSGTPAGTYTLTVSGTSGSLSHKTNVTVTVN